MEPHEQLTVALFLAELLILLEKNKIEEAKERIREALSDKEGV